MPNIYGESGSPYLSSLAPLKYPYMPLFIASEKVGVVTHSLIHWIKHEGNSKPCSTFGTKSQWTKSKAFCKSTLRTHLCEIIFLVCILIKSWARCTLFEIFLPLTEATYAKFSKLSNTLAILDASIFEMTLKKNSTIGDCPVISHSTCSYWFGQQRNECMIPLLEKLHTRKELYNTNYEISFDCIPSLFIVFRSVLIRSRGFLTPYAEKSSFDLLLYRHSDQIALLFSCMQSTILKAIRLESYSIRACAQLFLKGL